MALKDELRTRLAEQAQTIAALRERVAACVAALKEAQDNYHGACKTVAEMHEAATGRRGEAPIRGVIEDCAQIRTERDNWEETAAQHCRNEQYYRSLVVQIGEMFGVVAKTCDDGSVAEDVLCAKVPELATKLHLRVARLEEALECLPVREILAAEGDTVATAPITIRLSIRTVGLIVAALDASDPAWLEGRIAEAKREALLKMADICNARAFHVQAPMERAYLEIERECRAEAEATRPEGTR